MAATGEQGRWRLELHPSWVVFSYFGGMAAAALLDSALAEAQRPDLCPISVSAVFPRPLQAGAASAEVEVLRQGRSAVAVAARLSQGAADGPALALTALLGERAPASGPDPGFPQVPDPESCRPAAAAPAPGGGGPRVQTMVDWRCVGDWGDGLQAWIRPRRVPRTASGALDRSWYLVAADLLGPALVEAAPFYPFAIATVSLEVQLLQDTEAEWLLQRVHGGVAGRDAWGRLELWDRGGRLVAFANQRALLLPAEPGDLPYCVTGFGDGGRPLPQ